MAPHDDKVSLAELADAIRLQKTTKAQRPWWVNAAAQLGVGTIFAYMLIKFVTGEMSIAQKTILENTAASRIIMTQAQKDMGEFAAEDRNFKELMLMVMRQTCRNAVPTNSPTARSDRDACDVIRAPGR
jgi:hypothetical protein